MLLALSAQAQTTPVITEADMARARRAQPTITDQDIERARKAHGVPSAADLERVPNTAGPRIDALPQPQAKVPVDLEALSKAYALQMKTAQPPGTGVGKDMSGGPILMVFISLSMPEATLKMAPVDLSPAVAILKEAKEQRLTVEAVLDRLSDRCASDPEWRTKARPQARKEP